MVREKQNTEISKKVTTTKIKSTPNKKTIAKSKVTSDTIVENTIKTKMSRVSTYRPKLRIKLKSFDVKMLESSSVKIVALLTKSGADIKWPIPLPKKRKLYTVNTSHFVNKDSREQYERFTYTRMIDVVQTGMKTVESLQNISIPVGVMVEVKVF